MAKIRRVDFSPDEWITGTRELTLDERGAYWDVCSLMYSRGGPIADDETWIARALGCHVRTWRTIKARLLTLGKLTLRDGHLMNSRTERELIRAEGRLKSSREAAEESARQRRERAEEASTERREEPENPAQDNDFKDIPKATAPAADRAIYQLPTNNQQERVFVDAGPPKRASRKTKLPPDWNPTPEQIAYAKAQGCVDPADTAERFRLHHLSKGTLGADWNLGFQYWCRNEKNFRLNGQGPPRKQGGFNL